MRLPRLHVRDQGVSIPLSDSEKIVTKALLILSTSTVHRALTGVSKTVHGQGPGANYMLNMETEKNHQVQSCSRFSLGETFPLFKFVAITKTTFDTVRTTA